MMDDQAPTIENPAIPLQHPTVTPAGQSGDNRKVAIWIGIAVVVLLLLIIAAVYFLLQDSAVTERIRDIFIIFMALQSILIGFTLVILIVQLARLINLLQNEVKPILDSTNETVSTLRGTTVFLSDNLAEPVIKLNETMAGLTQGLAILGLIRKRPKSKP